MKNKSLVSITDFTKEDYLRILELAAEFEEKPRQDILKGYVISTLFF
jgi:aspartate carbamoyltransferase catalytic subunit